MPLIRSISLPLVARVTVAWGVLFAVVHFYWAAGGTALNNAGATDAAAQTYIGFIALVGLLSAAVAHGFEHDWDARLGRGGAARGRCSWRSERCVVRRSNDGCEPEVLFMFAPEQIVGGEPRLVDRTWAGMPFEDPWVRAVIATGCSRHGNAQRHAEVDPRLGLVTRFSVTSHQLR